MKQLTPLLLVFALISSCQTKKYHEDRVAVDLTAVPEVLHSVYQWQENKNQYLRKLSFENKLLFQPSIGDR